MIAGLSKGPACSRCVQSTCRAISVVICPSAESSAQAARRYANLHKVASEVGCRHYTNLGGFRSFSNSAARGAAKILEKDNGKVKAKALDMEDFPRERIRNISIIAHIDHGKSTLADRLLQLTGTLPTSSSPQFLDKLKVEKERGITVKAQTVSLVHTHTDGKRYLINLIDTPGHVDFSYEVSRSLGACEGALLLVDCTQGIQAQTLSVFHYAQDANLTLLPVINKVDLPHADPQETSEQIASTLGLPADNHIHISAKSGLGVPNVLSGIIDFLPPPRLSEQNDGRLRGLVFDTFYDHFRGVVSLVRLFGGSLKKGDKVRFLQAGKKYDVLEVGVHNPEEVPVDVLLDGQVGYVVCNMKNSDEAHIGDTICLAEKPVEPLPGFKPMKAMVYAGVFPVDSNDFSKLEEAIERLTLNDRSVSIQRESSAALSQGFRLGFLGTLHMDVFRQRLEDEYQSNVIITSPTVPFKVVHKDGREVFISNPAEFPDTTDPKARVAHIEEPMVAATIFVPNEYIGEMMTLCAKYRGIQREYKILHMSNRAVLRYSLPLSEIVTDFFSELKSASSGFASFDYEEAGYERSDLVKLNMMLNSKPVDALAMVVHRNAAQSIGRIWTRKLREVLPRQLFELAIQAAIGTKVVARETLSAMRKDVTAGLYGGHYERKMKHLEKQKRGKQRLKKLAGNIDVPQSAFFDVLSSRPRGYSTLARSSIFQRHYSMAAQRIPDLSEIADYIPFQPATNPIYAVDPERPELIEAHEIPPHIRSKYLSQLMSLATHPKATSADIYSAWTDLYLSSPNTQIFTPPELFTVLRAMHRAQQRDRELDRSSLHRMEIVKDVLADTSPRSSTYHASLILLSEMRMTSLNRSLSQKELKNAEAGVLRSFPHGRIYTSVASGFMYRKMTNTLLYLAARAGDEMVFSRWIEQRKEAGIEEDSHTLVVRLLLLANLGRLDEMVDTYNNEAAMKGEIANGGQKRDIIPLNLVLWRLASAGRWEAVADAYDALRLRTEPLRNEHRHLHQSKGYAHLYVPTHLQPSRETYSLLIRATAYQGNLPASLEVMRHMFGDDFTPHVPEYIALFEGFARFGEIAPGGGRGELRDHFPVFNEFQAVPINADRDRGLAKKGKGKISSIWSTGSTAITSEPLFKPDYTDPSSVWTAEALNHLFETFLTLHPSPEDGRDRAPSAKGVWNVIMAFARTHGCDADIIGDVWRSMRRKFGPVDEGERQEEGERAYAGGGGGGAVVDGKSGPNEQGWVGWKEDGRLRKLVKALDHCGPS